MHDLDYPTDHAAPDPQVGEPRPSSEGGGLPASGTRATATRDASLGSPALDSLAAQVASLTAQVGSHARRPFHAATMRAITRDLRAIAKASPGDARVQQLLERAQVAGLLPCRHDFRDGDICSRCLVAKAVR